MDRALTLKDADLGTLKLGTSGLTFRCRACGRATDMWCDECATDEHIAATCVRCGRECTQAERAYKAVGASGSLTGDFAILRCSGCRQMWMTFDRTGEMQEAADLAVGEVKILAEQGLVSPHAIELLASALSPDGEEREASASRGGLQMRYAPQSPLFEACVGLITSLDPEDHGYSSSWTVTVCPGPPYTDAQRILVARLIGEMSVQTGAGISFWQNHAHGIADSQRSGERLLKAVLDWHGDADGAAVSLCNAIDVGDHPGRFINAFRLLELVLDRMLDLQIVNVRHDPSVSDTAFRELVETSRQSLSDRLRHRVELLSSKPSHAMQKCWRAAVIAKGYNEGEACRQIVAFRNKHAHQPAGGGVSALPWEQPNFDAFVDGVLELVTAILLELPV